MQRHDSETGRVDLPAQMPDRPKPAMQWVANGKPMQPIGTALVTSLGEPDAIVPVYAKLSEAATELRHVTAENVSEEETAEVVAWVRAWASDCEWGDLDSDDFASMPAVDLLRYANRHIQGGLAFVLADVRRCTVNAWSDVPRVAKPEGN